MIMGKVRGKFGGGFWALFLVITFLDILRFAIFFFTINIFLSFKMKVNYFLMTITCLSASSPFSLTLLRELGVLYWSLHLFSLVKQCEVSVCCKNLCTVYGFTLSSHMSLPLSRNLHNQYKQGKVNKWVLKILLVSCLYLLDNAFNL